MITGRTPENISSAEGDSEEGTDTSGNEVLDGSSMTFVSHHNQKRACLEGEESFKSGALQRIVASMQSCSRKIPKSNFYCSFISKGVL